MDVMDKVRAWKHLESYLSKIVDPILQTSLRRDFAMRAKREWGFCPANMKCAVEDNPEDILSELTDEERALYERIQTYLEYGVDPWTEEDKRKSHVILVNEMIQFINEGHTYWEIPEEIQSDSLKEAYDEAFDIVFDVEFLQKNA